MKLGINIGGVISGADLKTVDHLLVGCVASKFLFISLFDELHVSLSSKDVNTSRRDY